MGVLILVVVVGIGGLLAYFALQGQQRAREVALVTTKASFDPARCSDPAYPISIEFKNGSKRSVRRISFTLEAFKPGYSDDVYWELASWDRIMAPGGTYGACWPLASYKAPSISPRDLNWVAAISSVSFD
jgi:hypothetical protein